MKAITYATYGPPEVLRLQETATPIPREGEVLVRVRAASVNAADWHLMRGRPLLMRLMGFGLLKPKKTTLGLDFAGEVEAVGSNAPKFRPGDAVVGNQQGGFSEFVAVKENILAAKPASVSFEAAAAVPVAASTALQALRDKGRIRRGMRVLIVGASGGVGTFAVQIARSFGAEVTAVCSTNHLAAVRSIGADRVIDYTREDFTRDGACYDLILIINGYHPLSTYKRALNPNGRCVMVGGGSIAQLLGGKILWRFLSGGGGRKLESVMAKVTVDDLVFLNGLLASGQVVPLVERQYPLSQVPEAIRYLEAGHAQGKLVISVGPTAAV